MERWVLLFFSLLLPYSAALSQAVTQDDFDKLLERVRSKDVKIQVQAAVDLKTTDLKDPRIRGRMWRALRDSNAKVREYAVTALGDFGLKDTEDLSPMVELLADSEETVRAKALVAISKNGQLSPASLIRYLNLMEAVSSRAADYLTLSVANLGPSMAPIFLSDYAGFDHLSTGRSRIQYIFRYLGRDASPALEQALSGPDLLLRQRALTVLRITTPNIPVSISILRNLLATGSSAEEREDAIIALGQQGKMAVPAIPTLIQALVDTNPFVRQRSAEALGLIGSIDAIPALIGVLDDRETDVRKEAVIALGKFGPSADIAVPRLLTLLKNSNASIQAVIIQNLGLIGDATSLPTLTEILMTKKHQSYAEEEVKTREQIIQAMGRIHKSQSLPALIEILENDPVAHLRDEAAKAFENFGLESMSALVPLIRAAEANQIEWNPVVTTILRRLWLDAHSDASSLLVDLLQSKDPLTSAGAAHALGLIGPNAASVASALVLALNQREATLRFSAAEALGLIGPEASITSGPALMKALRDKEEKVRQAAAAALGMLGSATSTEGVEALYRLLKDRQSNVKAAAARALGKIGTSHESIQKLIRLIEEEGLQRDASDVGSAAADALGSIGPTAADAIPVLVRALQGPCYIAAARALGLIKSNPSVSIPALINTYTGLSFLRSSTLEVNTFILAIASFRGGAIPYLQEALEKKESRLQLLALRTLRQIGQDADSAVPTVLRLIHNMSGEIRTEAFLTIAAATNDPDSVMSHLSDLLLESEEDIQMRVTPIILMMPRERFRMDFGLRSISENIYLLHYIRDELSRMSFLDRYIGFRVSESKLRVERMKAILDAHSQQGTDLSQEELEELRAIERRRLLLSMAGAGIGGSLGTSKYPAMMGGINAGVGSTSSREKLPPLPLWPPAVPSTRRILPKDLLGDDDSILDQAYNHLTIALENAGFRDHALFEVPDGFAVATKVERIHPDGSPYEGPARWTRNKLPLRSFSLVEYLGRLLWEQPGQFRFFIFVFSKQANIPTGPSLLNETEARKLAVTDGQKLPQNIGDQLLKQYNCQVLIYHFEKKTTGDAVIEIPSDLDAVIHLQKARLWTAFTK